MYNTLAPGRSSQSEVVTLPGERSAVRQEVTAAPLQHKPAEYVCLRAAERAPTLGPVRQSSSLAPSETDMLRGAVSGSTSTSRFTGGSAALVSSQLNLLVLIVTTAVPEIPHKEGSVPAGGPVLFKFYREGETSAAPPTGL